MRGITRTLGALFAASALAAPVWAGVVTGEPAAALIASFDGADDELSKTDGQTAWFTSWGGETPSAYITTKFGQGFQVASGTHPWVSLSAKSTFSCALYADISGANTGAVLVAFGTAGGHIALVKSAANTVQIWQSGALVSGLSVESSALSTGYHLLVFGNDTNGAFLSVDGATATTSTAFATTSTPLTTPSGGFQVGSVFQGLGNHSWTQAYGMKVDELRGYDTKLTTKQIETLADCFPLPECYTADLSASSEATINYSALTWDVGSAPGENAAVVIKTPSAGITITMDQASPALESLTVQGSGKLTLVPGSGLTGTALTTNALVAGTDVDVSALTASLGAVTVVADKTLTTGPSTTVSGVSFGSATAKVKVTGSAALSGIPYGMQTKTGTVEIEPQVNVDGEWAFNTVQTINLKANVAATRLVTGDGWYAHTTLNQLGGTITLSSEETSCAGTTNSAILLGHWDSATVYNLQAGTLSAPNGALCLGWDGGKTAAGGTTLTIGQSDTSADPALLSVYRLAAGEREYTAAVTVNPTGTLQVGAGGIVFGKAAKSVTLAGGTLLATATTSANIAHTNGLNVTAPSTIAAAPSAILTINKVSGSGNLTLGTAGQTGSVVISDVSAYTGTATASAGTLDLHSARFGGTLPTFAVARGATLILPAGKENGVTLASGASLKLVLSRAQLSSGYPLQVGEADRSKVTLQKVDSNGQLTDVTGEDGTVTDGVFTPAMTTWTPTAETAGSYSWSNASNWSKGLPTADVPACIKVLEATTIVVPADATCSALYLNGPATLTLAGEAPSGLGALTVVGNAAVPVALANAVSSIAVEADYTLTLDAGADGATLNRAIAVAGAIKKVGSGTLTLGENLAPDGGTTVAEGTLAFGAGVIPYSGANLAYTSAGNVTVEGGATLDVAGVKDAYLYTLTLKEGATYANSSTTALGSNARQLRELVLEGDATVAATSDFGIVRGGFEASVLNLNGHTLTKTGEGKFWLCKTAVSGGTLKVSQGTIKSVQENSTIDGDIVFDCGSSDTAFDFAGQQVTVNGAVTKRGTGTMTCDAILAGNDKVLTVEEGTLKLTKANTRIDTASTGTNELVTTVIKPGATLDISTAGATLYAGNDTFGGNQKSASVLVQGKLITREWCYDQAFGSLRTNAPTLSIDGGTVEFATDISAETSEANRRAFTVTANGATLIARDGVSVALNLTQEDHLIANSGTLNLTGAGAFASPVIPGAVTVSSTVGGTGSFSGTLTFNAGATLDVSAGPLTVSGTVTIADGATVTVTLPESAAAGTTILNCTNPSDIVENLTATPMPTGLKFAANEAGTAVVLKKAGDYTVGDKTFTTLQAALTSITTGTKTGTIVIDASAPAEIPLTEQILVNGAHIGLDLGGKKLTVDNATLTPATAPDGVDSHSGAIWVYQGSLTIYNGTVEATGRVVTVGALNSSGDHVLADNSAVLTLPAFAGKTVATLKSTGSDAVVVFEGAALTTSGNISTTAVNYCAICGNGSKYNTAHIIVEGGKISSKEDIAIYNPQYGSLKITGGTITGKTAVYVKGGDFSVGDGAQEAQTTISGGTLIGKGGKVAYKPNGNGATATGDALVIDNDNRYAPLTVTITGGQFSSENAEPIASYSNVSTDVRTGFVSGGKFNKAIAGSLCADGKCCVKAYPLDGFAPWAIVDLPAISGGESGDDVAIDTPEAKDVIGKIIAADTSLPTSVEVIAGTKSGAALPPAEVANALAIFGSSVTTTANEGSKLTITVGYDFGIDSMKQTESGIVITAKVQKSGGAAAAFADGVTVTLVDETDDTFFATATLNANGTATFDAFDPTDLVGRKLKVKATK